MDKQQEGIVIETAGTMAKVKTSRHNDCENCGACPGNAAMVLEARNPLNAKPGQHVYVEVQQVGMLKAAFIVYVLPLIAMFLGAMGGSWLAGQMNLADTACQIGGGAVAFILSVVYIKYFDHSARSDDKMQPVITRILSD